MAELKWNKEQRAEYLEHIRAGMRRGAAADAMGLNRRQVREYIEGDPEFEKAVLDGEVDATEHVEEALYQAAVSGNVSAAKTWLEMRGGKPAAPAAGRPPAPGDPDEDDGFAALDRVVPINRRRRQA